MHILSETVRIPCYKNSKEEVIIWQIDKDKRAIQQFHDFKVLNNQIEFGSSKNSHFRVFCDESVVDVFFVEGIRIFGKIVATQNHQNSFLIE